MYELALIVSLAVFAATCVWYSRQPFASVFHPITIYLLFHGLVFVLRPLFAEALGYNNIYRSYGFHPSPTDKLIVIACVNIGLLAFVAGAAWTGSAPLRFVQTKLDLAHRRKLVPALAVMLAICAPIAIASLTSNLDAALAGTFTMVRDKGSGIAINTTGNGYFFDAQLMLVPIVVLCAWVFRFRALALLPLLIYIVLRAGTGGRGPFVIALLGVALAYLFDRRRRWPTLAPVLAVLAILPLFSIVGKDRGDLIRQTVFSAQAQRQGVVVEKPLETMDLANLEFFEYLVYVVPQRSGRFTYFSENLQLFTEPIPRQLWRDKPIGAPLQTFSLYDYGYPIGITLSLPGQGWMDLGYAGVALWCGLWGLGLGAIYARFARGRQSTLAVAAYLVFLPVLVIAFRDGAIISIVRQSLFLLGPIVVWWLAARALGTPDVAVLRPLRRRAGPSIGRPARRRAEGEVVPRSRRKRSSRAVPAR